MVFSIDVENITENSSPDDIEECTCAREITFLIRQNTVNRTKYPLKIRRRDRQLTALCRHCGAPTRLDDMRTGLTSGPAEAVPEPVRGRIRHLLRMPFNIRF